MSRKPVKIFLAFLRDPAVWPVVSSITLVVTLFLQLFATWGPRRGVIGYMYLYVQGFFWFCMALGLAVAVRFAFSHVSSRLKRTEALTILRI
jgi:hypothetical protein